jgi:hypothetical protein
MRRVDPAETAYYGDKVVRPKTSEVRLVVVIDEDQKYRRNVFSATANYIRRHNRAQGSAGHFLFSRLYCGSSRTGYQHTEAYCGGTYDLASAMAISSAAVSPAQMKNLFIAILLLVLNFRLGQWLPNPGHKPWWPNWLHRHVTRWPSPFLVLASLLRKSEQRGYCFVTDGGHYENLGVGPLLRRNCRLMISSDVGHPDYQFRDFISLQRQQRSFKTSDTSRSRSTGGSCMTALSGQCHRRRDRDVHPRGSANSQNRFPSSNDERWCNR